MTMPTGLRDRRLIPACRPDTSRSVGIGTCSRFFRVAHVLVGKPVPAFPGHALVPVRLLAAPGGLEICRRQGVLGGLAGRADGIGRLRTELLVEELVQHLGAGLRPMADRHRSLRPDAAGVWLTIAEGP